MKTGNDLKNVSKLYTTVSGGGEPTCSISFKASPPFFCVGSPQLDCGRLPSPHCLTGDFWLLPSSHDVLMSLFDLGVDAVYFWLSAWRSFWSLSCRKDETGVCLADSVLPSLDSCGVGIALELGLGEDDSLAEA